MRRKLFKSPDNAATSENATARRGDSLTLLRTSGGCYVAYYPEVLVA